MTVQLPFDQAHLLDVAPLLRQLQQDGVVHQYGQQLVARKRDQPGDDFISRLCADGLGDHEIAMLSMALLFAGHETTVVAIGMGALCLLANPGQPRTARAVIRSWSRRRQALADAR